MTGWKKKIGVALLSVALLATTALAQLRGDTFVRFTQRNVWLGQPATAQGVVPVSAGYVVPTGGFALSRAVAINNGTAMAVGLVGLLADSKWEAGQWTHATTTYTADTADAQDADTNDVALETTTVNDGFLVSATVKFNVLSVDVTTAGSGTSPTHVIEYWNGSAWTAIAALGMLIDIARSVDWAAGERAVMFASPVDWELGGTGTNVPASNYNLRVRRTNATQATAALARRLYVGVGYFANKSLGTNAAVGLTSGPSLKVTAPVVAITGVFATVDEGHMIELMIQP